MSKLSTKRPKVVGLLILTPWTSVVSVVLGVGWEEVV